MKQWRFKGQITILLSLVFILLLSFIGGMVQSTSIHINKSMKRADTKLALESVFAEYESSLLEEYDIFAKLDTGEEEISERLGFYGAKNMEHKIQKVRFLTDSKGQAFFEQAIYSMGGKSFDVKEVAEIDWQVEEKIANQELEKLLEEEDKSLSPEGNPMEAVNQMKNTNFLSLILPESEEVSNRYVVADRLPSGRKLRAGTANYFEKPQYGVIEKYLFTEYLAGHFPNYTDHVSQNTLLYETEYLLMGYESDTENLEAVFRKIFNIRMGANYTYLMTDRAKQSEAEVWANSLCSLLAAPGAAVIVKHAILFAWAYGESIQDLRVLAQGNKVPIVKTKDTWQLSLEDVLVLGVTRKSTSQSGTDKGMNYTDYIKVFLSVENREILSMRALDLIELKTEIQVDRCITDIEIKSMCEMRRDIKDTFVTEYHYQ